MGYLFFATWVCAYPLSYFITAAIVARVRRGSWTQRARRELQSGFLWALLTSLGAVILVWSRPWILIEALTLVILWSASVYLAISGHERGVTNDLLLVALASVAPVLMYQIATNENSLTAVPPKIWTVCLISFLFFAGTVLHVKALIREAKNGQWHVISILFHLAAFVFAATTLNSWILGAPFFIGLLRTLVLRPGTRPSEIGAIEGILAVVLVVVTVLAEI